MDELFLTLLNMSINASWLCLAVFAFRLLYKKGPKWLTASLWSLVGLRLIFPFSVKSALSLLPSSETVPTDIMYSQSPQIYSGISSFNTAVNPIINEAFAPEPYYSANPLQIIAAVASYVWIFGVAVMLIYMAVSFVRVKRSVREGVPYEKDMWETAKNVFLCDKIDTPFILGVIKPKIYLPSSVSEKDTDYVLAHEKAHIKRLDHLWKPLGFLLLTVYWFNPVLWIAYILLCRDIELACDEKVMTQMGEDIKKSYSTALLNCSAPSRAVAACPLAFGETGVKGRIKSVLSYKKPAFWVVAVSVATSIILAISFLTDPAGVPITKAEFEFGSVENFYDSESLEVTYDGETMYYNEQANINRYGSTLDKIRVSEKPVSKSRSEKRSREFVIKINGSRELIFEEGFKSVWIDNGVKPTYSFKVLNPETAKELVLDFKHADFDVTNGTVEGYYLTIPEDGVMSIEVHTPSSSGGCTNADGKPFKKGERVYLEHLNGFESLKGVSINAVGEDGEIIYALSIPEEIKEYNGKWKIEYSQGFSATDLETAVSKAILDVNKGRFYRAECPAEGHIILGTEKSGDIVKAYVLEKYAEFGFENGWFIEQSGHSTACVMTFKKPSDVYVFIDAEYPDDGSRLASSVERLFPKKYRERVLDMTKNDKEKMWEQCVAYAEKYLKEIGREAEIGRYSDINHVLLTDMGVSVEVTDKLLELEKVSGYNTGVLGTHEVLEDTVRYNYHTNYIKEENLILYIKEKYDTEEIVEEIRVNSLTGEIISEHQNYKDQFSAKVIEVKKDGVLVEALEGDKIRKIGDRFFVKTDIKPSITIPDLYEGLYITVYYNGIIETTDPGLITPDAIYLYADVNPIGSEASPKEPTTTMASAEEKHAEDLVFSYHYYNDEDDSSYISLTPSAKSYFFSLSLLSSSAPSGTYEDKDGYVTLYGEKDTKYVFKRDGMNLVFQEDKSSQVPKYKYSADATEFKKCIPDGAVFEFAEKYLPYIDKAVIDVDGDGVYEDCVLSYGPTSGLFTVVFTASSYGKVKYKNTFNCMYNNICFAEKEGETYVYAAGSYPETDKESWFDISVKDGNIVLQSGDEMFPYWGEQGLGITEAEVPEAVKGDYTIYGEEMQNIIVYNGTDTGSFKKPHKTGDTVRLRHSGINSNFDEADIFDYDLTFEEVITGERAKNMLKEACPNFEEEEFLFEDNDVYLIKCNISYNKESDIKEHIPGAFYISAVDAEGNYTAVEHRLNSRDYTSEATNGEVSNLYPVFVPKGKEVKLVYVIGGQMEYPGPVANVYFECK